MRYTMTVQVLPTATLERKEFDNLPEALEAAGFVEFIGPRPVEILVVDELGAEHYKRVYNAHRT